MTASFYGPSAVSDTEYQHQHLPLITSITCNGCHLTVKTTLPTFYSRYLNVRKRQVLFPLSEVRTKSEKKLTTYKCFIRMQFTICIMYLLCLLLSSHPKTYLLILDLIHLSFAD